MSESTTTIKMEPGAINIDSMVFVNKGGTGINIKNMVVQLSIFENIMSPIITGEVILADAIGMTEFMNLSGEETIFIELSVPGMDDEYLRRIHFMHVYKMEQRINYALKNAVLVLCFCSIEAAMDANCRISKTYRGSVSDLVKQVINNAPGMETKKEVIVENTANTHMYTSNFWTPFQNAYYLSNVAINNQNNPSYLFFESREGYIFASLDNLHKQEPIMLFVKDQKVTMPDESRNFLAEYSRVLEMETTDNYDYFERLRNGQYGSAIYFFDVETKKLNYIERTVQNDFARKTLNDKLPFADYKPGELPAKPLAKLMTSLQHRSVYNGSPLLPINTELKRQALLAQESFYKTNIQVFGRLDYTVGRVVELLVYKDKITFTSDTPEDVIDLVMSGRYLITAISHQISKSKYVCNIELSKDSVIDPNTSS